MIDLFWSACFVCGIALASRNGAEWLGEWWWRRRYKLKRLETLPISRYR